MRALLLFAVLATAAAAQTPRPVVAAEATADSALVVVVMDDGTRFVGRVVSEGGGRLTLDTGAALVTLEASRIRSRAPYSGRIVDGRAVRSDPNRTRLLFAPTARAVPEGKGYVANYQIFFPFVAAGVGGGVTGAGGISLFPTFEFQLVYAAPKVTLAESETAAFAVGGIGVTAIGAGVDGGEGVGLVYGVGTFGPQHASVSAGAGVGFAFGQDADGTIGVAMLGGERQLSNSLKLVSENYLVLVPVTRHDCPFDGGPCTRTEGTDTGVALSLGVRFFNETLAADLAAVVVPEVISEIPFFPWLGVAYNF